MKAKNKKDLDESTLPSIDRTIVKLRILGLGKAELNELKTRLVTTKRKELLVVTRERLAEWAEAAQLYINPDTWDPKKKLPEGIPTLMTEELRMDLYKKYIREQDLVGQRHKHAVAEAEGTKKDKPQDFRWVEDPKKAAKKEAPKKKDPKAVEEPEEKELEEKPLDKRAEYIYVLLDDFETEDQLAHLEEFSNIVLMTAIMRNLGTTRKRSSEMRVGDPLSNQIRDSQVFVDDMKRRLDEFVEKGQGEPPKKEDEDLNAKEQALREFYLVYIRKNMHEKQVWSWHTLTMNFDAKQAQASFPAVHWAYPFREQLFRVVYQDTGLWKDYLQWLEGLQLQQVTATPAIRYTKIKDIEAERERARKEKEEQARIAEEEAKAKKGGKPDPKKAEAAKKAEPAKKGAPEKLPAGKKGAIGASSKVEDLKASTVMPSPEILPSTIKPAENRQLKVPPPSTFRTFEIIERQLKPIKQESIGPGLILETFIDEIEAKHTGSMRSQLLQNPSRPNDAEVASFLNSVFGNLMKSKMVDEKKLTRVKEKSDSTAMSSFYYDVNYEQDFTSVRSRSSRLHNQDIAWLRNHMLMNAIKYPDVVEFMKSLDRNAGERRSDKLKLTEDRAFINTNLKEFSRLKHVVNFEKLFQSRVGLIDWNFKNRTFSESLSEAEFNQWLVRSLREEPQVVTSNDTETNTMYLGLYFKCPPGRILYKQWQSEKNAIPSYESYLQMTEEQRSGRKTYFNLAEDQFGNVLERETVILPADGSRIEVRISSIAFKDKPRVLVFKRDMVFGLKEPSHTGEQAIRDVVRADLNSKAIEVVPREAGQELSDNEHTTSGHPNDSNLPRADVELKEFSRLTQLDKAHEEKRAECFIELKDGTRLIFETLLSRLEA